MASKESNAVTKLYQSWLNPTDADSPIQGPAQWDVLSAEPGQVDYLETQADGVPVMWALPHARVDDRVLLCIHGGGFISGSIYTHRKLFAHMAKAAGVRALLVGYRILPQGVHPAPVDDVVTAYRWLLDQGVSPGNVVFTGDSAGGALSITSQLRARDRGLPLPAGAMPLSPWTDFEVTGASIESNSGKDVLFSRAWIERMSADFRAGADPKDPQVSPIYADLTDIGPLYIQVGADELLLDDSRRLADQARTHGVQVTLDIYPEMQHTFHMMAGRAPEADHAINKLANWARHTLRLDQPIPEAS
jgi:acetyl esterase/lipase